MNYHLSVHNPLRQFLTISFAINVAKEENIQLQLPSWRPGRYELGNFAKNIRDFSVIDQNGHPVRFSKKTKDLWEIDTSNQDSIQVTYNYYANHIDGGSTYVDEEQWYLNFINCLMYQPDKLEAPCTVTLDIADDWQIACGLAKDGKQLTSPNFYQLVDSPAIISGNMQHFQYSVEGHAFHLWFQGEVVLDEQKIIDDFEQFTRMQIDVMGEFPTEDYHFLFQFVPYKAYHGVEHFNSTCIVLGPGSQLASEDLYDNFLGVSSHELFHTWNIIRIRPTEMFPYNFSQENYFRTGYVAEGVTTYYGDLFLVRSQTKPLNWYLEELNKLFKRHFENYGRFNYSVAESSFDLWLDGYEMGIPDRKVSIYVKGAIITLMMDLMIRIRHESEKSFDDVMLELWKHYKEGNGFSEAQYQTFVEKVLGDQAEDYFDEFVNGKAPVEEKLKSLLEAFGLTLTPKYATPAYENNFGYKASNKGEAFSITKIAPESPAEKNLMLGDEVFFVNGNKIYESLGDLIATETSLELDIIRNGKHRKVSLTADDGHYFMSYEVAISNNATEQQINRRKAWLGQ